MKCVIFGMKVDSGMSGGHMNDVLLELIMSELGPQKLKDNRDVVIENVVNGIRAYKRNVHDEGGNGNVEFINQGCFNVVVKVNGVMLRVAKTVSNWAFRQNRITWDVIQKCEKECFLIPKEYVFSEQYPRYAYWVIDEMWKIEDYDYEKYKKCVRESLEFIQETRMKFNDYKYDNIMTDGNVYKIIDFDLMENTGMEDKCKGLKQVPEEDVYDLEGKVMKVKDDVNLIDRHVFLENYVATRYFEVDDKGYVTRTKDGYDEEMLLLTLVARLFLLKVKQDKELNRDLTVKSERRKILITKDIVKNMLNMKSTRPEDVVEFNE